MLQIFLFYDDQVWYNAATFLPHNGGSASYVQVDLYKVCSSVLSWRKAILHFFVHFCVEWNAVQFVFWSLNFLSTYEAAIVILEVLNCVIQQIPVFYRGGFIIPTHQRPRRSSIIAAEDPYTLTVSLNLQVMEAVKFFHANCQKLSGCVFAVWMTMKMISS